MKVCCKVTMSADFWMKTGAHIPVDDVVEYQYDEDSKEYEEVCKAYQSKIGFDREDDVKAFDKEVLQYLGKDTGYKMQEKVQSVVSAFKESAGRESVSGYVSFGSLIVKIKDVSAIKIKDFDVKLYKE